MWLENFQRLDIDSDIALLIWSCELKLWPTKRLGVKLPI